MAGRRLTIHSSRHRFAVRLNSGVSPQKKRFSAKSFFFFFAKAKELLCPTLARAPAYLGPDTPPPGGTSLGFKPKPIIQAFGGNSRLQWANNSFKPTPLRGVVVTSSHPSVPASATLPQRRGLIQALGRSQQVFRPRAFKPRSVSIPGHRQQRQGLLPIVSSALQGHSSGIAQTRYPSTVVGVIANSIDPHYTRATGRCQQSKAS